MTIPNLEVNLGGCFEYGQGYVALSRATSLEGLRIVGFTPTVIRAHARVVEFYQRLSAATGSSSASSSSSSSFSFSLSAAGEISGDRGWVTAAIPLHPWVCPGFGNGANAQGWIQRKEPPVREDDTWMEMGTSSSMSSAASSVTSSYARPQAQRYEPPPPLPPPPPGPLLTRLQVPLGSHPRSPLQHPLPTVSSIAPSAPFPGPPSWIQLAQRTQPPPPPPRPVPCQAKQQEEQQQPEPPMAMASSSLSHSYSVSPSSISTSEHPFCNGSGQTRGRSPPRVVDCRPRNPKNLVTQEKLNTFFKTPSAGRDNQGGKKRPIDNLEDVSSDRAAAIERPHCVSDTFRAATAPTDYPFPMRASLRFPQEAAMPGSVAVAATPLRLSSPAASPALGNALTLEQRKRIEANRSKALALRQRGQNRPS